MGAKLLQPSFGGGEYAPALWGRQDLARYGVSGRYIRNWIVRPTGGLDSRPGLQFIGAVKDSTRPVRVIEFEVSEDVAYVVVLNAGVMQFVYQSAWVESAPGVRVEVAHPWTDDEVAEVRFTQSADTMFLVHRSRVPKLLKRTSATSFTLTDFVNREGPFRVLNANDALLLTASARTGTVTITSNFDLFTPNMVGALLYLEPKALGNIKPWAQGERTPTLGVGVLRRSDGKVYKATNVPFAGIPPSFTETGNIRPTHETGKEWDGPGDWRDAGGVGFVVGVEWEYQHSGYGIVLITGYTDAKHVTAEVKNILPPEVVGGIGAPANTWTLSGTGAQLQFAVPGASSDSQSSYTVAINGDPV